MNHKEEELYELPEWVKLVSRVLHGSRTLNDEKRNFVRNAYLKNSQEGIKLND